MPYIKLNVSSMINPSEFAYSYKLCTINRSTATFFPAVLRAFSPTSDESGNRAVGSPTDNSDQIGVFFSFHCRSIRDATWA